MKCFYHNNEPAVGICKSCQRGICHDCVGEVTNGIACRNKCEEQAEQLNNLIDVTNSKATEDAIVLAAAVGPYSTGVFFIVLASIFSIVGIWENKQVMLVVGIIMLLFGVWSVIRVLKARRSLKASRDA